MIALPGMQAGARLISQPPAPDSGPLSVMKYTTPKSALCAPPKLPGRKFNNPRVVGVFSLGAATVGGLVTDLSRCPVLQHPRQARQTQRCSGAPARSRESPRIRANGISRAPPRSDAERVPKIESIKAV